MIDWVGKLILDAKGDSIWLVYKISLAKLTNLMQPTLQSAKSGGIN